MVPAAHHGHSHRIPGPVRGDRDPGITRDQHRHRPRDGREAAGGSSGGATRLHRGAGLRISGAWISSPAASARPGGWPGPARLGPRGEGAGGGGRASAGSCGGARDGATRSRAKGDRGGRQWEKPCGVGRRPWRRVLVSPSVRTAPNIQPWGSERTTSNTPLSINLVLQPGCFSSSRELSPHGTICAQSTAQPQQIYGMLQSLNPSAPSRCWPQSYSPWNPGPLPVLAPMCRQPGGCSRVRSSSVWPCRDAEKGELAWGAAGLPIPL